MKKTKRIVLLNDATNDKCKSRCIEHVQRLFGLDYDLVAGGAGLTGTDAKLTLDLGKFVLKSGIGV